MARHTRGTRKNGDGLPVLKWFQQGRMDLLSDYCRKDVEITRNLFLFGLREHHLLFQNKAGKTVRLPVNFRDSVKRVMENGRKPAQGQSSVL